MREEDVVEGGLEGAVGGLVLVLVDDGDVHAVAAQHVEGLGAVERPVVPGEGGGAAGGGGAMAREEGVQLGQPGEEQALADAGEVGLLEVDAGAGRAALGVDESPAE